MGIPSYAQGYKLVAPFEVGKGRAVVHRIVSRAASQAHLSRSLIPASSLFTGAGKIPRLSQLPVDLPSSKKSHDIVSKLFQLQAAADNSGGLAPCGWHPGNPEISACSKKTCRAWLSIHSRIQGGAKEANRLLRFDSRHAPSPGRRSTGERPGRYRRSWPQGPGLRERIAPAGRPRKGVGARKC